MLEKAKPFVKWVKGMFENYSFVLFLVLGAIGVQITTAWLSKNPFTLYNYAILIPLIVVAQYAVTAGYHYGTENSSYLTTHVIWSVVLLVVTVVINYLMFGTIPGTLTMFALLLATAASIIATIGK